MGRASIVLARRARCDWGMAGPGRPSLRRTMGSMNMPKYMKNRCGSCDRAAHKSSRGARGVRGREMRPGRKAVQPRWQGDDGTPGGEETRQQRQGWRRCRQETQIFEGARSN